MITSSGKTSSSEDLPRLPRLDAPDPFCEVILEQLINSILKQEFLCELAGLNLCKNISHLLTALFVDHSWAAGIGPPYSAVLLTEYLIRLMPPS